MYFSRKRNRIDGKKKEMERKRRKRTKLCELFGLCLRWRTKKREERRGGSGQETDTVILINGVCRVINVCPCVHWPAIFLRMRGNSESTGISGLPFCLLIYLRGCKVSFLFQMYVFFFFFFFHHVSFFLNPSQFPMI